MSAFIDWSPLHQIIKTGNGIKKFNEWMAQYPFEQYRDGYDNLADNIKKGYLNVVHYGNTPASHRKCCNIQKSLLGIFDFEQQIDLLSGFNFSNNQLMIEYYPLLKFDIHNPQHQKLVREKELFATTFSQLFYQQRFDEIDFIETFFNFSFVDQPYHYNHFIFKQPNFPEFYKQHGLLWKMDQAFGKPYYGIIYNYSEEKEAWLHAHGIDIPRHDIIEQYRKILDASRAKNPKAVDKDEWDKLYGGLSDYEKILHYFQLSHSIEQKHGEENLKDKSNHDAVHKMKI
jgi:hypothetical protein